MEPVENFLEIAEEQHRKKEIIDQYMEAVRSLNKLFREAPVQCYKEDGIGCCKVSKNYADIGFSGPAFSQFMKLRDRRLHQINIEEHGACPYHKMDHGCTLEGLKSPYCLVNYCEGELDDTAFDPVYIQMKLEEILLGGKELFNDEEHPVGENWEVVEEIKNYVDDMIEQVEENREDEKERQLVLFQKRPESMSI